MSVLNVFMLYDCDMFKLMSLAECKEEIILNAVFLPTPDLPTKIKEVLVAENNLSIDDVNLNNSSMIRISFS